MLGKSVFGYNDSEEKKIYKTENGVSKSLKGKKILIFTESDKNGVPFFCLFSQA